MAPEPIRPTPDRASSPLTARQEELYDEYLDLLLGGGAPSPDDFLRARDSSSDTLAGYLRALALELIPSTAAGDGSARTAPAALPFERVGDFRLLRLIGRGGMGMVYLAQQESLGRKVALKIVRPEYAASQTAAARFEREAHAVARLRHSNIVDVYAAGAGESGARYIAMEFVPGRGLDEILEEHATSGSALSIQQVLRWGSELARALHYAHEHGVVHRDVKPSNIRIAADGRALLLDFGLAHELDTTRLTMTDGFLGSPGYAAPEQLAGRDGAIDGRTDVYGLGAVLYHCLAGCVPFAGDSLERVLQQVLNEEPPPLRRRRRDVPRDLETVIHKAIEKEPERRYSSAAGFASDLEAILEFRPIAARPAGPARRAFQWARRNRATAAALVLLVALLASLPVAYSVQRTLEVEELLRRADESIVEYRRSTNDYVVAENEYRKLTHNRGGSYLTPAQEEALDRQEDEFVRKGAERDLAYNQVLDLCARAEERGADPETLRQCRARLYFARFAEAQQRRDAAASALYLGLLRAVDPDDENLRSLWNGTRMTILTEPPGAEVFLFRLREHAQVETGGEHRRVPVPFRRASGATERPAPGEWTLRVVRGAGELRTGDHVVSVAGWPIRDTVIVARPAGEVAALDRLVTVDDTPVLGDYEVENLCQGAHHRFEFERLAAGGSVARYAVEGEGLRTLGVEALEPDALAERGGVPAEVWRDGVVSRIELPHGLVVRTTAAPLLLGPESRAGVTPILELPVEDASDLLLYVRAPGHEPLRAFVSLAPGQLCCIQFRLVPEAHTPPGFVRIVPHMPHVGAPYAMQEREVTMREYFEFLEDPATLAEIRARRERIRFPRAMEQDFVQLEADGSYRLAPDYSLDWPALGVSWDDACAYAAWRTARERAAGARVTYSLPNWHQWRYAMLFEKYSYGGRLRAKWVSSCYARAPGASPEPPLRFPIDETCFGVYDMTGSMSEWLADHYHEDRAMRHRIGGNWAQSGTGESFSSWAGYGSAPDRTSNMVGFRLVARVDGDE